MSLKTIFSAASDDTLHLLENCLRLNPAARFTATQVNSTDYDKFQTYSLNRH